MQIPGGSGPPPPLPSRSANGIHYKYLKLKFIVFNCDNNFMLGQKIHVIKASRVCWRIIKQMKKKSTCNWSIVMKFQIWLLPTLFYQILKKKWKCQKIAIRVLFSWAQSNAIFKTSFRISVLQYFDSVFQCYELINYCRLDGINNCSIRR